MTTTMVLAVIDNAFSISLFLYPLYLVGGVAQNSRKIIQKLEAIEKELGKIRQTGGKGL